MDVPRDRRLYLDVAVAVEGDVVVGEREGHSATLPAGAVEPVSEQGVEGVGVELGVERLEIERIGAGCFQSYQVW